MFLCSSRIFIISQIHIGVLWNKLTISSLQSYSAGLLITLKFIFVLSFQCVLVSSPNEKYRHALIWCTLGCPLIFESLNFCLITPSIGSIGHKNNACKIFLKTNNFRGLATRSKFPKKNCFPFTLGRGAKNVSQKHIFFYNIFSCSGWPWIQ